MATKRPIYVVQKRLGFQAVVDGKLEEAVIVFGYRQSRASADMLAARQEGAEVVKGFITS